MAYFTEQKGIGTAAVVVIIVIVAVAGIGGYFVLKGEGAPAPAEFEVSNLTFYPSEVGVGEPVVISATVKNVGDLRGIYTVEFKIDGVTEATKNITLAGGATETISFNVNKNVAQTYNISVDGLTGSFTITEPETGLVFVAIYNYDYDFYNVSISLNDVEVAREDWFANGYWNFFVESEEVTGYYELRIEIELIGIEGIINAITYAGTVGDEASHYYYDVSLVDYELVPDTAYLDGVWTRFYFLAIEAVIIGLHV